MNRSNGFQIALIVLCVVVMGLFSTFFYRELFPEYREYQHAFWDLEGFRSIEEGRERAPFTFGVKQVVMQEGTGPAQVDRCISCHVSLDIPDYGRLRPVRDESGQVVWDAKGHAVLEENPDYVFTRVREKIVWLAQQGHDTTQIQELLERQIAGRKVALDRVLVAHPLLEGETRPFEIHGMNAYGCVVCHGGNGRALTTIKAHGPVFDGEYPESHMGPKPRFLEVDEENDPPFARMFNHRPGHGLLFQTTPLLIGSLMEAKCVQCHKTALDVTFGQDPWHVPSTQFQTFARGERLFFSQGCYACHSIEGLSRGGVGPELTESGFGYPWFLKESMVWPQADLESSTMPNFHLDHRELEALMTYLLAQRGRREHTSPVDHLAMVRQWREGKMRFFEQPVEPDLIENVEAGLWTFAHEGCASCHRLKGFDSAVEVTGQGFAELIHEDVTSRELVEVLESKREVLDSLVIDRGQAGVLDRMPPEDLLAYSAPFSFAYRVHQDLAWKEYVMRILKQYVQEYGFGRVVGPRLNVSGIYRSDAWLMEHFWNPQSHVARSIMPAMPFDSTKFWQLTYMLKEIGKRNRDAQRKIWNEQGFSPKQAYELYCAQCHGDQLRGNGPVSEWIYPIPKNLRSAEFLRNYTKQNAITSIVDGVQGTPMPPWSHSFPERGEEFAQPVLTPQEAQALVEWIFESLPGGNILEDAEDSPKWNYTPQDVLQDLIDEGAQIQPLRSSLFPLLSVLGVEDVFTVVEGEDGRDKYYIRDTFYTEENLAEGKRLFALHCAMCHGREADGGGERAESMDDAKPRMLTNPDWMESRDDLRLLRSIKYGVHGTSMTSFADVTTTFQRMQMIAYVRTLSKIQRVRKGFESVLFQTYSTSERNLLQYLGSLRHSLRDLEEELALEMYQRSEEEWIGAIEVLEKKLAIEGEKKRLEQKLDRGQQKLEEIEKERKEWMMISQQIANLCLEYPELAQSYQTFLDTAVRREVWQGVDLERLSVEQFREWVARQSFQADALKRLKKSLDQSMEELQERKS